LGPDVAALGAEIGRRPDRYEQVVLDDLFARRDDGTAAVTSAAVIAPTVQVKRSIVLQAVLAWLFLDEEPRVLWWTIPPPRRTCWPTWRRCWPIRC
jgi:hypothetical protein